MWLADLAWLVRTVRPGWVNRLAGLTDLAGLVGLAPILTAVEFRAMENRQLEKFDSCRLRFLRQQQFFESANLKKEIHSQCSGGRFRRAKAKKWAIGI